MSVDSSFMVHPTDGSNSSDDVDSLPSSQSDSDTDVTISGSDVEESDAEREWRESIQQLELLLNMVVVPLLGKMVGRKFAYWGWKRYMEWKYPVEIVITNKAAFTGAGAVEAAATL
ncbi:MAG: hypothetical protein Q9227_002198 [Pyrenula ochraceoflavens]